LLVIAISTNVFSQEHSHSENFNRIWNSSPRRGEFTARRGATQWHRDTTPAGLLKITTNAGEGKKHSGQGVIKGNGKAEQTERQIDADISEIKVNNLVEVRIRVDHSRESGPTKATLFAEEAALRKITTEVDGETLSIGIDDNLDYQLSRQPTVLLEVPNNSIQSAKFFGGSTGVLSGFADTVFDIQATDSTHVRFEGQPESLVASATGNAQIRLVDSPEKLYLTALDKGIFSGSATDVNVNLDGNADVFLSSPKVLSGECNGLCALNYTGNPQVNLSGTRAHSIISAHNSNTEMFTQ